MGIGITATQRELRRLLGAGAQEVVDTTPQQYRGLRCSYCGSAAKYRRGTLRACGACKPLLQLDPAAQA